MQLPGQEEGQRSRGDGSCRRAPEARAQLAGEEVADGLAPVRRLQQGAAPQPDRQQEQDGPGQKGQPSARPAPPQKQTLAQHAQLPRHGQGHQDQKQHHHRHVFPPEFTIL